MMLIEVKGFKKIEAENLLIDYNGTIACDGYITTEIKKSLVKIADSLKIYVITADTNGNAASELEDLPVELLIIKGINEDLEKLEFLNKLGADKTIVAGNGNNDALILKESILGIGVIGAEGIAKEALLNSDIIVKDSMDAFDLLLKTKRLIATMRK
mgnify:CR=1 FL=1